MVNFQIATAEEALDELGKFGWAAIRKIPIRFRTPELCFEAAKYLVEDVELDIETMNALMQKELDLIHYWTNRRRTVYIKSFSYRYAYRNNDVDEAPIIYSLDDEFRFQFGCYPHEYGTDRSFDPDDWEKLAMCS